MKFRDGRVVKVWRSVDGQQALENHDAAGGPMPAGFYCVMRAAGRRRIDSTGVRPVTMYGPYASAHIARVIETSARAFGLLPAAERAPRARDINDHISVVPAKRAAVLPAGGAKVLQLAAPR